MLYYFNGDIMITEIKKGGGVGMVKYILFSYTPYTEKERAKAILFNNANFEDFVLANIFDGVKYYKKVK